jgi:hypothetical protein
MRTRRDILIPEAKLRMKKAIVCSAAISAALTLLAVWGLGGAALPSKVKLENARVRVTEVTAAPGSARERGIRQTDQVIVFLDDCRYERTDPASGEKTVRERKSGDVIWHSKGEDAPLLVNAGEKAYRTLVIELK